MYATGSEHEYQSPCRELLRRVTLGEIQAVTDAEVHQEIIYRYLSVGLPNRARDVSADFEGIIPTVFPITLEHVRTARQLSLRYARLPARDLIHVAVMMNNGIESIVSADRHFDSVREVRRLDPIALAGANA